MSVGPQQLAALQHAAQRRQAALQILDELQLFERWRAVGYHPVLVGAAAYDLMVAPDLDLEVFCPGEPQVSDGFTVLAACAQLPGVTKASLSNLLESPDQGLYWQLRLVREGVSWKVDMWAMTQDHPGPLSSTLVEPLRARLTPAERAIILDLKQQLADLPDEHCPSVQVYRAVLHDGVTTLAEFRRWRRSADLYELSTWLPS